jgi:glycosyltransferase involved in cell wall biosynthesis
MQITIITPTFQSVEYLPKMFHSCLSKKSIPITNIVCDNLSTDGLADLIFSMNLPNKIVWSSQRDHGPAQAINRGFEMAETEIIGWINSDDFYADGAIDRVSDLFTENPNLMLIYGLAEHINLFGDVIGSYPTLPPRSSLEAFRDGNFVCQPTIFFRKELLSQVGLLDDSLKTAFDFDWLIRAFKCLLPDQIGYIDQIQAYSRLHNQCLTKKYRQLVMRESVQVIAKHFGVAPIHWLKTYFEELCHQFPLALEGKSLEEHINAISEELKPFFDPKDYETGHAQLIQDMRLKLSDKGICINMDPDGWVSKKVLVKLNSKADTNQRVSLVCNGDWPMEVELGFTIRTHEGDTSHLKISSQDEFILELEMPSSQFDSYGAWLISCDQTFIPAVVDKNSSDIRELSFKILDVRLHSN